MQSITLGYSPCPNDTYIFGGLAKGLVDSQLEYDIILEDVEQLNRRALNGELMVTKLSYHAFAHVVDKYEMLPYGSALGFGVGPLLITKNPDLTIDQIKTIAIPGEYTTANMLLKFAIKDQVETVEVLFSDIEDYIQEGRVDAGVIIHENRFTYLDRGFTKLLDLGAYWESKTQLPIPLGGIALKRNLPPRVKEEVLNNLKQSIHVAETHFDQIEDYIKENAQEMNLKVMQQHINLYVNGSTKGLSEQDNAAIAHMLDVLLGPESLHKQCLQWNYTE